MGVGGLMHRNSEGDKELLVTSEEEDRLHATKIVSFAKVRVKHCCNLLTCWL